MSREDVESVVRRWSDAFARDDDEAFRDTLHPEIEWHPFEERHSPSHGHEGAMRIKRQWLDTWDEHRLDLEEMIHHGEDVVSAVHVTARGRASGVEVDVRLYGHFRVRDGKVVYLYEYEDRDEALAAAGISE